MNDLQDRGCRPLRKAHKCLLQNRGHDDDSFCNTRSGTEVVVMETLVCKGIEEEGRGREAEGEGV